MGSLSLLNVLGGLLLVHEATQRRKAEYSLATGKVEAEIVGHLAHLGTWSWDIGTDLIQINAEGRKLLGIATDAPLSFSDFLAAFHPQDRVGLEKGVRRAARIGEPFTRDVRTAESGSSVHYFRVSGTVSVEDEQKAKAKCSGIFFDISSHKNMEAEVETMREELSHSVRAELLGGLSGVLAHELKQPLTAILSNAQAAERMLQHSPINVPELSQTIHDIIEDDSRAGAVIRHLRSLFKNDKTEWTILNVNQVVHDAIKIVKGALAANSIELHLDTTQAFLCVRGNRTQLQQVVLNLILNAIEAMNSNTVMPKKLIVVTRNDNDEFATIAVEDSGPGLPEDIQKRIFAPFFTTKVQGLGLGLSICRSIVTSHGGRLRAANNNDRGATLFVDLPFTRQGDVWSIMNGPPSS